MAQRSNDPDLDLADLGHLSRSQLRDLWHKEVGEQPPGGTVTACLSAKNAASIVINNRHDSMRRLNQSSTTAR